MSAEDRVFKSELEKICNRCNNLKRQSQSSKTVKHFLIDSLKHLVHERASQNMPITNNQRASMKLIYDDFIQSGTKTSLPLVEKISVDLLELDVQLKAKNRKLTVAENEVIAHENLQKERDNLYKEAFVKDEKIKMQQIELENLRRNAVLSEHKAQKLEIENKALQDLLTNQEAESWKLKQEIEQCHNESETEFNRRRANELERDRKDFDTMKSDLVEREAELNQRHLEDLETISKLEETKSYLQAQIDELSVKRDMDDADLERLTLCRKTDKETIERLENEMAATEMAREELQRDRNSNVYYEAQIDALRKELDATSVRLRESDAQKLRAKEYLTRLQKHMLQRKEKYKCRLDEFEASMDALNKMCTEQTNNYQQIHYSTLQKLKHQLKKMQNAFETLIQMQNEQNEYLYHVLDGMERRMQGRLELDQDFLDFMENVKDMKSRIYETSVYLKQYLS